MFSNIFICFRMGRESKSKNRSPHRDDRRRSPQASSSRHSRERDRERRHSKERKSHKKSSKRSRHERRRNSTSSSDSYSPPPSVSSNLQILCINLTLDFRGRAIPHRSTTVVAAIISSLNRHLLRLRQRCLSTPCRFLRIRCLHNKCRTSCKQLPM